MDTNYFYNFIQFFMFFTKKSKIFIDLPGVYLGFTEYTPAYEAILSGFYSSMQIVCSIIGVPSGKCGFTTLRNFPDFLI